MFDESFDKLTIITRLNDIMHSLQADIRITREKHEQQINNLQIIIDQKDKKIVELTLQLQNYQKTKCKSNQGSNNQSYKKIVLHKKNYQPISHFHTLPLNNKDQLAEKTLAQIKIIDNIPTKQFDLRVQENVRNIVSFPQKNKSPTFTQKKINIEPIKHMKSFQIGDKQNYKHKQLLRMPFSSPIQSQIPRRQRSITFLGIQQKINPNCRLQISDKKQYSSKIKQKSIESALVDKKCINVVIPVRSFNNLVLKQSKFHIK